MGSGLPRIPSEVVDLNSALEEAEESEPSFDVENVDGKD